MESLMTLLVGLLISCGLYLMLERNLLRFIFGLILLSNGVNLLIVIAGRITRAAPPLIPEGQYTATTQIANALPQALVLTAIVIGFGLTVFTLALILRTYERLGTIDTDELSQLTNDETNTENTMRLPDKLKAPNNTQTTNQKSALTKKRQASTL